MGADVESALKALASPSLGRERGGCGGAGAARVRLKEAGARRRRAARRCDSDPALNPSRVQGMTRAACWARSWPRWRPRTARCRRPRGGARRAKWGGVLPPPPHRAPAKPALPPPRPPASQEACNQALGGLLAWTNHAAAKPLLGDPAAAAPLLRALRGALAAGLRWGSASVPRQAVQLALKTARAVEARGAGAGGGRRQGPAAGWAALDEELLQAAAALLRLTAALPPRARHGGAGGEGNGSGAVGSGGGSGGGADTTPLYLQAHGLARAALLSIRRCLAAGAGAAGAGAAGAQQLADFAARAARPAGRAAAAGGSPPDGWLASELQAWIAGAVGAGAKPRAAAAAQQTTPARAGAPALSAATPPPTGERLRLTSPPPSAPSPAPGGGGTPGGATPGSGTGSQRPYAAALAVSALQTWGVLAQLLGPTMLQDKAAGQALLNVRMRNVGAAWRLCFLPPLRPLLTPSLPPFPRPAPCPPAPS
jgi:hypothetical protein